MGDQQAMLVLSESQKENVQQLTEMLGYISVFVSFILGLDVYKRQAILRQGLRFVSYIPKISVESLRCRAAFSCCPKKFFRSQPGSLPKSAENGSWENFQGL